MVAGAANSINVDMNDPIVWHILKVREQHAQQQTKDYSHVFREKSRFDLIRLSCVVIAIELAYAAETAFVSPILLQIGVDHRYMTMVWGLSPLLGFFVSPLLGSISDRCRSSLGRRRPIMICLSIGILLGLILVPYGKYLGSLLGDVEGNTTDVSKNMAAFVFTILGTVLLDFNADTCQTPSRAYLLDVCIPGDHAKAMSTFSFMAGIGGTFGYALGGIDWSSTNIGSFFGGSIRTVFVIVIIVFAICATLTITSFREIPLSLIEKDPLLRPLTAVGIKKELDKKKNQIYNIENAGKPTAIEKSPIFSQDIFNNNNNSNYNSTADILTSIESDDVEEEKISLGTYLKSIVIMPPSMRILCLTNLLCHMAHLSYCLYFTDFVGEAVYGGDPTAESNSVGQELYEDGVRYGCWGLSVYAFSCFIYSTLIEIFMKWTSARIVYVGGILLFAIGMLVLAIFPSKVGVMIFSPTAGILYATLLTMPFILVAKYHSRECFKKLKPGESTPLKQSRGLGTDIAIISSMVFLGQIIVSFSMGSLISLVGSTSAVLYTASGAAVLAAFSALNILYIE